MNIITTIPKREDKRWVDALFKSHRRGWPIEGRIPAYPPVFPFACRITLPMAGGILYLVYDGEILGRGLIKAHIWEDKHSSVGLKPEGVGAGDRLILRGAMKYLDCFIPCTGFQGFRYTSELIHKLEMKQAQKELRRLGLRSVDANARKDKHHQK